MSGSGAITLLPDAGPLITLAYADSLDLLLRPGWTVALVDMVLAEITRNATPTSERIAAWVHDRSISVIGTQVFARYEVSLAAGEALSKKRDLGELAIQEAMNAFAIETPPRTAVFLFEDHKIARASFLVPADCVKVTTRAYLLYLEEMGLLASAAEIERRAIQAGRTFSQLRFPDRLS